MLLEAGRRLSRRQIYGLVWLDANLIARSKHGPLVDFIATGRSIVDSLPPLIGLEDDIRALPANDEATLELPGVAIIDENGTTPRLNLAVLPLKHEPGGYLLLVTQAITRMDSEYELARQTRARLMAEAEVVAKSHELARANRDLEDFASIVAHDLRAPMRAMRYLADDLEGQIGTGDTRDAAATLAQMRALMQRLSGMMTGLHEYSSVGRKRDAVELVKTRELIDAVVQSLPKPPDLRIEIAGEWPEMKTLAAPLDLVMRNLIDNAIKHHDRSDGTVRVTACHVDGALEIVVADDGPGIADEHRNAVFLPFRTLSAADTQSGSGLGLALVKRTIEQVGGHILLSNEKNGRGAAFTIAWPTTIRG